MAESSDHTSDNTQNAHNLCKAVEINNNIRKPNHKPGIGTEGEVIKLISNYYQLILSDTIVYHYNIRINPGRDGPKIIKMRKLDQRENMDIIAKLASIWSLFRDVSYVYDGLKNLYTNQMLKFDGNALSDTHEISYKFDGGKQQKFEVSVQYCNEFVEIGWIKELYDGTIDELPRETLQIIEIILKYVPTRDKNCVPIGRALYSREPNKNLGNNAVMVYGHYQSVHLTEKFGACVVIDRKATVLRAEGALIEYIRRLIPGMDSLERLARFAFTNDVNLVEQISKQLKGLRIYTTYVGNRRHIIDKFTAKTPDQCTFQKTNVVKYFWDSYGIKLDYKNIPCVLLKGPQKRYLPVELCYVCSSQPLPRTLITKQITSVLVKHANSQSPIQRFANIQKSAEIVANKGKSNFRDIGGEHKPVFDAFGINMCTEPIKLNGRVINAPECDGIGTQPFKEGIPLKHCFFIILSDRVEHRQALTFANDLKQTAKKKRMDIQIIKNIKCEYEDPKTISKIFERARNETKNKLQMIMFCIPSSNPEIYRFIKYYGDMVYGVITQCVRDDRVLKTPNGYHSNLVLKINSKLNGKNSVLSEMPAILKKRAMIIGADVSHPSPGDSMVSSIASCVGSYDTDYCKYFSSVSVQTRNREEIITHFGAMIKELFEHYMLKNNGFLPEVLIIFRDGVSETQFNSVLDNEYKLLVETCMSMRGALNYLPSITFVIVQKRHHTRFIPLNPNGKQLNIPKGTVVDNTLTNPMFYEYFLCSHIGLLGTSRPAKYVILKDENNLSADEMQKLTYYLCYTYARCDTPISIPKPVKYAHLAAERSKFHIIAQNIKLEIGVERETKQQSIERDARNAAILNEKVRMSGELKERLYFC